MQNSSCTEFSTSFFTCPLQRKRKTQVFRSLSEIDDDILAQLFQNNRWMFDYLQQVCEPSSSSYYVLYDNKPGLTLCIFQLVTLPMGMLTGFLPPAPVHGLKKHFHKIISNKLKRTEVKLLVLGNQFITNHQAIFSSNNHYDRGIINHCLNTIKKMVNYDAILVKDQAPQATGGLKGFERFEVDPAMTLDLSGFSSFDDYLASMRTKYRQRYKRCNQNESIQEFEMSPGEILQKIDQVHGLFSNVLKDGKFNIANFSKDYLVALCRLKHARFFGYRIQNNLVGFRASLASDHGLVAHLVGYEPVVNEDSQLYQRMLFDFTREAFTRGHKSVFFGRTAIEIKSTLGAMPRTLDLFLKLRNTWLNQISGFILRRLKPTDYLIRSPFKQDEN